MDHGTRLPTPSPGDELDWIRRHLAHPALEPAESVAASTRWRGGQQAARLVRPQDGSARSYTAWRKASGRVAPT